jgi:glycosyltransferase involved in cell wall biosynthesis
VDHPWFAPGGGPLAVAAGSLQPWKGFADAIEAIALLRDRGVAIRLAILGEGPLRGELEALIAGRGLADRVLLVGHVDNPLAYFSKADIFVLSSLVEGLPNVLVEAMMCGCTPVSTDCPTGPREVLQDGRFGYLVPMRDPAALADGIEKAIRAPTDPELLAEAVKPFGQDIVLDRHFALLGLDRDG